MKYFKHFDGINELKVQFRDLSMKYHPDVGGDEATFKEMLNEYEGLLEEALKQTYHESKVSDELEVDEQMRQMIDKIIHLEGIVIEIIGNWMWVSGETYPYRKFFKEIGLKFAGKKKVWYWKPYKYRKQSKKHYSMDKLREEFSVTQVETKQANKLTE